VPLPPMRRPAVLSALPLAFLLSAMAALPERTAPSGAGAALFTAPLPCQIAAPVSTWFDHDPLPGRAVNWAGIPQDLLRRPFADGHNGTDYAVDRAPVLALAPGAVRETRRDAMGALVVVVDHGALDGTHQYQSRYVHLSSFAVTPRQTVGRGQLLGISGNTGLSSGPHLHLTLLQDGHPIDPYRGFWRDGKAPCPPS
jgi:murein DD-endopeptidase MepM/ murein hydrolase activator NlpD